MGIKTKLAKGPNPLSIRKKQDRNNIKDFPGKIKKDGKYRYENKKLKRRPRKGKRSKFLNE
jgi:hypothetical protein